MKELDCQSAFRDAACLARAYQAFSRAAAGEINPSELARWLRELFSGCEDPPRTELCREIKEFLDLDLSDYAYSLALHDQPAIEALQASIKKWSERLGELINEKDNP